MPYFYEYFEINERLYKSVANGVAETKDYIIPSGKTLRIIRMGANSSSTDKTNACIVWDPGGASQEIHLSTYSDVIVENVGIEITGDGVKVLRINLTNDCTSNYYLGAWYQGVLL
jgi:hypothetical protein